MIASWFESPTRTYFFHYFWDSKNPIWDYGKDAETTKYFLLHCQNFTQANPLAKHERN